MQQLRGREGTRVRALYRQHSVRTGVPWERRAYRPGEPFASGDDVNRLLSAAHSCLYGICHAGIVAIGASPALGFVHTGGALSFVHDVADLYKADYTIPLAFDLAATGHVDERDARLAFRDKLVDGRLLHKIVADVFELLKVDPAKVPEEERHQLWDDRLGGVLGGKDWSSDDSEPARPVHQVISGPPVDQIEARE